MVLVVRLPINNLGSNKFDSKFDRGEPNISNSRIVYEIFYTLDFSIYYTYIINGMGFLILC